MTEVGSTQLRAVDSAGPGNPRVLVAMLTYRRLDRLDRALPQLVAQLAGVQGVVADILVVDNDPSGGARTTVARHLGPDSGYLHEPRPGIAAARNAALHAAADAGAVVFIDDDEVPGPGWLAALVRCWLEWGCAGVAGPAVRSFDGTVPEWVARSGFFARTERPTGMQVPGAATNNLLLDLTTLRSAGLSFDERFGLTGGSDTLLTRSLTRAGHQIRWCDEAEVIDPVPVDRATRSWVLRRSFRTGTTWSRVHVALEAGSAGTPVATCVRTTARRFDLTVRSVVRIATALPWAVAGRCGLAVRRGPAEECRLAGGLGMFLGAWGYAYVEYGRGAST